MSKSDDEHRLRVKRGAFPTPSSEIERAERFVPESANAADTDTDTDTDGDDATPGTNDATVAARSARPNLNGRRPK